MLFVLTIEVCVKTLLRWISIWKQLSRGSYVFHAAPLFNSQTNNSTGLSRKKLDSSTLDLLKLSRQNCSRQSNSQQKSEDGIVFDRRKKKEGWTEFTVVFLCNHSQIKVRKLHAKVLINRSEALQTISSANCLKQLRDSEMGRKSHNSWMVLSQVSCVECKRTRWFSLSTKFIP